MGVVFKVAVFLVCSILNGRSEGVKYHVDVKNDMIYEPCIGNDALFIGDLFDLSGMTHIRLDNDSLLINGTSKLLMPVGENNIQLLVTSEYLLHGEWVGSPLTVERLDLCEFLISKTDILDQVYKNFNLTKCPFDPEVVYTFDPTILQLVYDIPLINGIGDYRFTANLWNQDGLKVCFVIPTEIY